MLQAELTDHGTPFSWRFAGYRTQNEEFAVHIQKLHLNRNVETPWIDWFSKRLDATVLHEVSLIPHQPW
ncbi:hypothetical protein E2P81_ATG09819 [Venturia nashicola]|nr:hypothetical protein E2P81_ATG09819 [Venturia nashicola]